MNLLCFLFAFLFAESYKCAAVLGVPALLNEKVENMVAMNDEDVSKTLYAF